MCTVHLFDRIVTNDVHFCTGCFGQSFGFGDANDVGGAWSRRVFESRLPVAPLPFNVTRKSPEEKTEPGGNESVRGRA